MTDSVTPEATEEDSAAVGFAMLMVGVEAAVASAATEIAMLGQAVQQGSPRLPVVSPPALSVVAARAPGTAIEPFPLATPPDAGEPAAPLGNIANTQRHLGKDAENSWQTRPKPVAPAPEAPLALARAVPDVAPPPPPPASLPAGVPAIAIAPHWPPTGAPDATRAGSTSEPRIAAPVGWASTASASAPAHPANMPRAVGTAPVALSPAASAPIHAPAPWVQQPVSEPQRPEPVAPLVPTPAAATRSPPGAPATAAGVPRAEAASRERSAQSQTGDIFFDGTRVGQWLSDTLARAAGGPARGSTGFDPRMGARWPGALQGR